MLISKTPLRVSFLGGGTDFLDFSEDHGGQVLSCTIDKYIYVFAKRRFDELIRVGYTKTELVSEVDQIEHELVREALKKVGITKQIEISTMGDIPSRGSGLGSSSCVTVGLLNAFFGYQGRSTEARRLAEMACEIEIDTLGKPIGRQDQYAVAFGGLNWIRFHREGGVRVEPVRLPAVVRQKLDRRLMLFYTNMSRKSESILTLQLENMDASKELLLEMGSLVSPGVEALLEGDLDRFADLVTESWKAKKTLAEGITTPALDDYFEKAVKAGAGGGKITGAGGGGFLLLYCREEKQEAVRRALDALPELPFRITDFGSRLIYDDRT